MIWGLSIFVCKVVQLFSWNLWDATSESEANYDPKIALLHRCRDDKTKQSISAQNIFTYSSHTTQHTAREREREREAAHLALLLCKSMASMTNVQNGRACFFIPNAVHYQPPALSPLPATRANTWLMAAMCQRRKSAGHAWLNVNGEGVNTQSWGLRVSGCFTECQQTSTYIFISLHIIYIQPGSLLNSVVL